MGMLNPYRVHTTEYMFSVNACLVHVGLVHFRAGKLHKIHVCCLHLK
jgi:hypothetical protein